MNPSFIQLDPNTRNPLGSPSRLGHVAPNVNSKFFWSNSPELPSPILVLSSQSPPAPQFSNQRPKTPITRKAQCSMTHYRLQFVPPHPHKNSPKVPSWATTRPKTIAARLKTDLSVRLSQFLRPPQSTPSPSTLFPEHPSSPTESLYFKLNRGTLLTNCFRNFLVQISNIWPNTTAHCVRILTNKFLKLGTSQGKIWNHSDYTPPFPFFVLHFRTKKKLPFRFITNGNNPSFETQVFQTGFIALCLPLKYYYIFAPKSTVENSKSGAARSAPK